MARFRLRLRATEINLPVGEVLIGRGPECFLRINEPMVSRRHARLRVAPDRVAIEDLGSRNGTQVNGVSVSEAVLLNLGDLVSIGTQHFTLEFEDASRREPTGQHELIDFEGPDRQNRPASTGSGGVAVAFGSAVSGPTLTATAASLQSALSQQSGRRGPSAGAPSEGERRSSLSPQSPPNPGPGGSAGSPAGTRPVPNQSGAPGSSTSSGRGSWGGRIAPGEGERRSAVSASGGGSGTSSGSFAVVGTGGGAGGAPGPAGSGSLSHSGNSGGFSAVPGSGGVGAESAGSDPTTAWSAGRSDSGGHRALPMTSAGTSAATSAGTSGGWAVGNAGGFCGQCGAQVGDVALCPRCGQATRETPRETRGEFTAPPAPTGGDSTFRLFWGFSDKVLAMGRVDEAERMMGPRLEELLDRAKAGQFPDDVTLREALRRALKLAGATRRDRWFAWLFDYAGACGYRLPLLFMDEVYAAIFTCRPMISPHILSYAQTLQSEEALIVRLVALRKLCRE